MKIKENDKIPNSEIFVLEKGEPTKKNIEEILKNKKVIIFGITKTPFFMPTCGRYNSVNITCGKVIFNESKSPVFPSVLRQRLLTPLLSNHPWAVFYIQTVLVSRFCWHVERCQDFRFPSIDQSCSNQKG